MPFSFLEQFGSQPGLDRVTKLLSDWGNPERKMKVILVSGTKGKGSTVAFLASMLRADGKKVGEYYSPHLIRFSERIVLDGKEIPDSEVLRLEKEIKEWISAQEDAAEMKITYFEAVTACAYRYFAEQGAEYAVMEVGMGGRLDAVNAADEEIAIITSIGRDHVQYLGSQISQIAYEKAGILKKGLGITSAGIGVETIRVEARKRRRNLLVLGEDFDVIPLETGLDGSTFDYSNKINLKNLKISLLGKFQLKNAAAAVCAAENLGCSEKAIREGLLKAKIKGRMEIVRNEPLVLVDAAHNPLGIKALVDSLDLFGERKVICVFSCMKDKDVSEMLCALGEKCSEFFVAKTAGTSRAMGVEELEEAAGEYGQVYSFESVSDAVKAALEHADKEDLVLITGSIYMMNEVYKGLEKKS